MWLTKKIMVPVDFSGSSRPACEVGDVGLIVIGTHGRRGLPRAILGSVAEKVVRLSPVPVLTVHGADTDAAETNTPGPRK
jgi:hypothetical protein